MKDWEYFQIVSKLLGISISTGSVFYYQIRDLYNKGESVYKAAEVISKSSKMPRPFPIGPLTGNDWERMLYGAGPEGGNRLINLRKVKAGRKKFKLMKLVGASLNWTEQHLGIYQDSTGTFSNKHLVSEFNPGTGGYVPIYKSSSSRADDIISNPTPMHVYDLNLYLGGVADNDTNFAARSTNQNTDCNSRAWFWSNSNQFRPLYGQIGANYVEPRYYRNDDMTDVQDSINSQKVYRKGICVDFQAYGTRKMHTEFEFRIIKITDPRMCPDYLQNLADIGGTEAGTFSDVSLTDFKQAWQNMIRAWTINPMLKGIEPGPPVKRRWFTTVAKKRVSLGEQLGDVENVTAARGRIYVNLNEVCNLGWDLKGFTTEEGDAAYDQVPQVETTDAGIGTTTSTNRNYQHKPHYRARYYLVIRALCPLDLSPEAGVNQDGASALGVPLNDTVFYPEGRQGATLDYCPTYDLAIRTTWATLNGQ